MSAEGSQMKAQLKDSERGKTESSEWFSRDGIPLVKITCAASELINTGNFSNVTVGPVSVARFVTDGDDEHLAAEVQRTQALCEAAVAEERETIQLLLRSNAAAASRA